MPDPSGLVWNERAGRYRDRRTGRFVSATQVRADLDRGLVQSGQTMRRLAEQLRTRQIDPITWELAMRAEVKRVQLYSAAVAKGGLAQITPADRGRIGAAVREQYRFLARFAQQIEDGLPLDGRFLQRVQLYAEAGRPTYHRTEGQEMARRGYAAERSVLGVAEHCDECVSEAARGWVEIGALRPIGSRQCLSRCKCHITYGKAGDEGVPESLAA